MPSASSASGLHPLPRAFFERDPVTVARSLLGKVLVRKLGRTVLAGRIVEDEAYLGADDAAAHSASGRTARNAVIFGPAGHAYVYFIYGMHYCLNVSCMPAGDAGCVLIRALEPLSGLRMMARNRRVTMPKEVSDRERRMLTSGPSRLCEAFGMTRAHDNDRDMTRADSGLWLADDGYQPKGVVATPRIGITKSAAAKLRFLIAGNEFVSGKRA